MKCRGWKAGHQVDRLVRVEVQLDGARRFPASYDVCLDCLRELRRFHEDLNQRAGRQVSWLMVEYYPPDQPAF